MTDLTPPPRLTPDEIGRFTALCTELEEAAENNDGNRAAAILGRIQEIHPLLSEFMAEGIVGQGFANLSERMGQGDSRAYAIVRDLQARFGPDLDGNPADDEVIGPDFPVACSSVHDHDPEACAPEAPVTDATTTTETGSRGTVWAVTSETFGETDTDAGTELAETFVRVDDISALIAIHRAAGASVEVAHPFGSDGTGIPTYVHIYADGRGVVTYRRANPGESDL